MCFQGARIASQKIQRVANMSQPNLRCLSHQLVGSIDIICLDILAGEIIVNDQVQNIMFGDAKHLIDFGRTSFGMEALHWTAVQVSI